ncbi:hypothetical protein BV25DRAFT_1843607 [Artomyces pyxidatus]|uniref:Uncharacterized protein n=1 Tax=Artomyces pyxidatus TaxID=48021 RepID=A0ACB8SF14_9AGAM|nr:hypothetical protein BV25DRAFT_1843607 [Artomyces pyxidatus]
MPPTRPLVRRPTMDSVRAMFYPVEGDPRTVRVRLNPQAEPDFLVDRTPQLRNILGWEEPIRQCDVTILLMASIKVDLRIAFTYADHLPVNSSMDSVLGEDHGWHGSMVVMLTRSVIVINSGQSEPRRYLDTMKGFEHENRFLTDVAVRRFISDVQERKAAALHSNTALAFPERLHYN